MTYVACHYQSFDWDIRKCKCLFWISEQTAEHTPLKSIKMYVSEKILIEISQFILSIYKLVNSEMCQTQQDTN